MFTTKGYDIMVSRKDAGTLYIHVTAPTGEDIPPDGTIFLFTVKKDLDDVSATIEKRVAIQSGTVTVALSGSDTDIEPGKYWWDVREIVTGGAITPVFPQGFFVKGAVGNV